MHRFILVLFGALIGSLLFPLACPLPTFAAAGSLAAGSGIYEDDSDGLVYTGSSWRTVSSSQDSEGTSSLTTRAGSVFLSFEGTGVSWQSRLTPNSGINDVYIDGELRESIDRYSRTASYQQTVFSVSDLDPGAHTIEIRWTGASNPSATGSNLLVDSISVLDTDAPFSPESVTAAPQNGGALISWDAVPDAIGYIPVRAEVGDPDWTDVTPNPVTATEYFDGALLGGTDYQYAVVAVDESGNRSPRSVASTVTTPISPGVGTYQEDDEKMAYSGSGWRPSSSSNDSRGSSHFTSRTGSVSFSFQGTAVKWISRKSPSGGIAHVFIDDVQVAAVDRYAPDNLYQQIVFEKRDLSEGSHVLEIQWTNDRNPEATGSTLVIDAIVVPDTDPPVAPRELAAERRGTGISLGWSASTSEDVEKYRVYRADGLEFDLVGEADASKNFFEDPNVSEGITYEYVVTAVDRSGNESVRSNEASASPAAAPGVGTYEEDSPYLIYSGESWQTQSGYHDSQGGVVYTTRSGSVTFTFKGTAIAWLSRKTPSSGINDVYIDGRRVARIDRYAPQTQSKQTVFQTDGLSDSTHVLELRWTGLKNAKSSGSNLMVDAFTVVDVDPPQAPTELSLTKVKQGMHLKWAPNLEEDLEGYRVFRTLGSGALQDVSGLITSTSFTDVGIPYDALVKYEVKAYDATGNESNRSVRRAGYAPSATSVPAVRATDCPAVATVNVKNSSELKAALNVASPGEVIRLSSGIYSGSFTMSRSGLASKPIWICGDRNAVINGGSIDYGQGLYLNDVSHVRVAGFSITNSLKGLSVVGGTGVAVSDMSISDIGYEAIHVREFATNTLLVGNNIRDSGRLSAAFGEGIYIGSSKANWCSLTNCQPDRVTGTLIAHNDIASTGAQPIELKEGTSGGVVYENIIDGARGAATASSWILAKGNDWFIDANTGMTAPSQGFSVIETDGEWGFGNVFTRNRGIADASGHMIWVHKPDLKTLVGCENRQIGFSEGLTNFECQK